MRGWRTVRVWAWCFHVCLRPPRHTSSPRAAYRPIPTSISLFPAFPPFLPFPPPVRYRMSTTSSHMRPPHTRSVAAHSTCRRTGGGGDRDACGGWAQVVARAVSGRDPPQSPTYQHAPRPRSPCRPTPNQPPLKPPTSNSPVFLSCPTMSIMPNSRPRVDSSSHSVIWWAEGEGRRGGVREEAWVMGHGARWGQ